MPHNVTFNVKASTAPDDTTVTLILHIANPGSGFVLDQTGPASTTSFGPVLIPNGNGYLATLWARNAQGLTDANPPTVQFNVADPPPLPAPGDPTLGQPIIV